MEDELFEAVEATEERLASSSSRWGEGGGGTAVLLGISMESLDCSASKEEFKSAVEGATVSDCCDCRGE